MEIRPISDLRNNLKEIENVINEGEPVYLTKNGYGSMVVLSLEEYSRLIEDVEVKLDEADRMAAATDERLTHQEVFCNVRESIRGNSNE